MAGGPAADFEAVLENKPFIMNVYHSVSREQIETYLFHLTHDLLYGVVQEKQREPASLRRIRVLSQISISIALPVSCLTGSKTE